MAAELEPVYLFGGSDRPKVERALRRLRARIGGDAVEIVSAADRSGEDAVAACNALGLFGLGGRLVVVEGADRWKAADVKAVASYLKDPAPETVLALVVGEIKKDAPLAKACVSTGKLLIFDVSKRQLPGWIAGEFKRLGATADADACHALLELVGQDVRGLATEIAKVACWAAGERITDRDVNALVAPVAETPGWAVTDAWGRRDVAGVLSASESLLEQSPKPRRDELPRLAGMVSAHVTRVRQCQRYAAEGLRPREAASRLKRDPFYVEKLYAQANRYTPDELGDAVVRLAELDLAVKGGSRLAGDLELQRALIDLTPGAPETAPAMTG